MAYRVRRPPKNLVNLNLPAIGQAILMAVSDGVNTSGARMYGHAQRLVPVRKIYHFGDKGGGRRRGLRGLSPQEIELENPIRKRLGLGPALGVQTAGRMNIVGTGANRMSRPLGARNRHHVDTYNSQLPTGYNATEYVPSPTGRGRVAKSTFQPFDLSEGRLAYRQVRQIENRPGHRMKEPTRGASGLRDAIEMRRNGILLGGSLRRQERRMGLPFGTLGKYELEHSEILAQHLTARGRYELGILKSGVASTALNAGRAVTATPGGGLQVGGRLKREVREEPSTPGPRMEFRVVSPTPYAKYVEFGTRHAAAQPYLRPAVGMVRERFRRDIIQAVKRARGPLSGEVKR